MAKMSIAQLREKALDRFNAEYIGDFAKANNLVTRFYRLSALEGRLCELENDERTYNTRYTQEQSAKADRMRDKLNFDLNKYGLHLAYYGIYPHLEVADGTQREALTRWYY